MRFIGHLDLLKIVQRIVIRAKLPIAYSNGFNPHQQMSFALPLPLSMESVGEYLDIELTTKVESNFIKTAFNEHCPNGLFVTDVVELKEGKKPAASELRVASYKVIILDDCIDVAKKVLEIKNNSEVVVLKKTKKSEQEVDIKSDIYDIDYNECNKELTFSISTGSKKNIKPDLILSYIGLIPNMVKVIRIEMFLEEDGKILPLI